MLFYLKPAADSESLVWFISKQPSNQIFELFTNFNSPPFMGSLFLFNYFFESGFRANILKHKGGQSSRQFIEHDSQSPKIYTFAIAQMHHHFWSAVEKRSSLGLVKLIIMRDNLSQSEIAKFGVTVREEQNILGGKISIKNMFLVQILQGQDNRCSNKLHSLLSQLAELCSSFSTLDKTTCVPSSGLLHNQVNKLIISEGVFKLCNKRMIHISQNFLLELETCQCFMIDKFLSWNSFHCIPLLNPMINFLFQFNLQHTTQGSLTKYSPNIEGFEGQNLKLFF